MGAAITIKPNATRVLQSWDFLPDRSRMVSIEKGSFIDGTNMNTMVPNYYKRTDSMYAVHREDLHNQLRELATQEEGSGRPCEVIVRHKVVDYVSLDNMAMS